MRAHADGWSCRRPAPPPQAAGAPNLDVRLTRSQSGSILDIDFVGGTRAHPPKLAAPAERRSRYGRVEAVGEPRACPCPRRACASLPTAPLSGEKPCHCVIKPTLPCRCPTGLNGTVAAPIPAANNMPMMPLPPGAGQSVAPVGGAGGGALIASGRKLKILVRRSALSRRFAFPRPPPTRPPRAEARRGAARCARAQEHRVHKVELRTKENDEPEEELVVSNLRPFMLKVRAGPVQAKARVTPGKRHRARA